MARMRKHWRIWLLGFVTVLVAAVSAYLILTFGYKSERGPEVSNAFPEITQDTYQRVELLMTEEEIEAVVGGPPGDYTRALYAITGGGVPPKDNGQPVRQYRYWVTPYGYLAVGFAEDGRACSKSFDKVVLLREPTLFERVFGW